MGHQVQGGWLTVEAATTSEPKMSQFVLPPISHCLCNAQATHLLFLVQPEESHSPGVGVIARESQPLMSCIKVSPSCSLSSLSLSFLIVYSGRYILNKLLFAELSQMTRRR